jgi:hypothetical protein
MTPQTIDLLSSFSQHPSLIDRQQKVERSQNVTRVEGATGPCRGQRLVGGLWHDRFYIHAIFDTECRGVVRKNSIRALFGVNASKTRPVTMVQARPHAIHFKPILDFGEGQGQRIG